MRTWILALLLAACDRGDSRSPFGGSADMPTTTTTQPAPSPPPAAPPSGAGTLRRGDKVKAQWKNGKWYSGTLTAVYSDSTADVRYDDGDRSKGLPFEKIELVKRPLFEVEVSDTRTRK